MRRAGLALTIVVLGAWAAHAAQYPAWGDTGWVYASKRDCCNAAIAIAQQYSANACATSGGVPRPTSGIQRGSCQWDWMQAEDGGMLYRCYAESSVWCR
jgi:hypothetical protein